MVDEALLKILVCPEDKTPVQLASEDTVNQVNGAISGGALKNRGGELVSEPIEAGLIREDGAYLSPIRDDIPVMIIDEGIPLAALQE